MAIIRFFLTIFLIIGVYFETGIYTTIFAILVALSTEVIAKILKDNNIKAKNNYKRSKWSRI